MDDLDYEDEAAPDASRLDEAREVLVVVDRLKLVNPDVSRLVKGADGLFRTRDGAELDPDADVRVAPGAVEGSNVNMVDGLVEMIELSRRYETQVRMMNIAKEGDEATAELLRIS